ERCNRTAEVRGSIPLGSTSDFLSSARKTANHILCDRQLFDWLSASISSCPLLFAISVDRREDTRQLLALVGIDVGMPYLEQQYGAVPGSAVPGCMLEAVVENQKCALAPFAGFGTDAQPATLGDDQGKMTDEPRVEHAVMRLDMRAGGEAREECDGRA